MLMAQSDHYDCLQSTGRRMSGNVSEIMTNNICDWLANLWTIASQSAFYGTCRKAILIS